MTERSAAAEALVASRTDPDRFAEVFDRHYNEIYSYIARRLGRDLAEDLASETFTIAFRKRASFDAGQGDARPWLYGVASNLIRREYRRETRAYQALQRFPQERHAAGHEDGVVARVTAESAGLAGALAKLSKGDREVLLLVALAGLSYDEVAAALGIAYGTVCSRLSRARRKLRAGLPEGVSKSHG